MDRANIVCRIRGDNKIKSVQPRWAVYRYTGTGYTAGMATSPMDYELTGVPIYANNPMEVATLYFGTYDSSASLVSNNNPLEELGTHRFCKGTEDIIVSKIVI